MRAKLKGFFVDDLKGLEFWEQLKKIWNVKNILILIQDQYFRYFKYLELLEWEKLLFWNFKRFLDGTYFEETEGSTLFYLTLRWGFPFWGQSKNL